LATHELPILDFGLEVLLIMEGFWLPDREFEFRELVISQVFHKKAGFSTEFR
jgi:hypothetical protein